LRYGGTAAAESSNRGVYRRRVDSTANNTPRAAINRATARGWPAPPPVLGTDGVVAGDGVGVAVGDGVGVGATTATTDTLSTAGPHALPTVLANASRVVPVVAMTLSATPRQRMSFASELDASKVCVSITLPSQETVIHFGSGPQLKFPARRKR
jgi:hypothetical protein